MRGSFSAVWTATIAGKDAFSRDSQDLQDLHAFAPLESEVGRSDLKFAIFRTINFRYVFVFFLQNVADFSFKPVTFRCESQKFAGIAANFRYTLKLIVFHIFFRISRIL